MSKTSDKDPVRFSSPYEHKETVGDVAINEQPIKWFPTKMPQIDPLITTKGVAYYIDRINALEIENKRLDDERLTALAETERLTRIIQIAANKITDTTGTCPVDLYWDDCDTVCTSLANQDEAMASCWIRYFTEREVAK